MNTKISSERTYRKVYKAVMEAPAPVRSGEARLVHGSYSNHRSSMRPRMHVGCLVGTLGFQATVDTPLPENTAAMRTSAYAMPVRRLIEVGIAPQIAPVIVEALEAGFEDCSDDVDPFYSSQGIGRFYRLGRRISKQYTPNW